MAGWTLAHCLKIAANEAMSAAEKKDRLDALNAERDRLQLMVRKRWNQIEKSNMTEGAR